MLCYVNTNRKDILLDNDKNLVVDEEKLIGDSPVGQTGKGVHKVLPSMLKTRVVTKHLDQRHAPQRPQAKNYNQRRQMLNM